MKVELFGGFVTQRIAKRFKSVLPLALSFASAQVQFIPERSSVRTFDISAQEGVIGRGLRNGGFALWKPGTLREYSAEGKFVREKVLPKFLVTGSCLGTGDLLVTRDPFEKEPEISSEMLVERQVRAMGLTWAFPDKSFAGSPKGPLFLFIDAEKIPEEVTNGLPLLDDDGHARKTMMPALGTFLFGEPRKHVLAEIIPSSRTVRLLARVRRKSVVHEEADDRASIAYEPEADTVVVRTWDQVTLIKAEPGGQEDWLPRQKTDWESAVIAFESFCQNLAAANAEPGLLCVRNQGGRVRMVSFKDPWRTLEPTQVNWRFDGGKPSGELGNGRKEDWAHLSAAYRFLSNLVQAPLSDIFLRCEGDRVWMGFNTASIQGSFAQVDFSKGEPKLVRNHHARGFVPYYAWPTNQS